jgi:RNA polymerase sigma factor (TIGR02999 family)
LLDKVVSGPHDDVWSAQFRSIVLNDITQVLNAVEAGDLQAGEQLLPLVYQELRRLAAHKLANETANHTLQPTALVHEVWVKLVGNAERRFKGRDHFFAAAAEAMRRILIDSARRKRTERHGGKLQRVELEGIELPQEARSDELMALNAALDKLAQFDSQKAEIVKLRFFVGMTNEEIAEALCVAVPTVKRHWSFARAWLYQEIASSRAE